jgi:PEP-CTERM motif
MISTLKSRLVLSGRVTSLSTGAILLLLLTSSPVSANVTDFVQNGDFAGAADGELDFDTTVPDWTAPAFPKSYVFIWDAGTADTTGAQGVFKGGPTNPVRLWGPGDGSSNGLTASGAFIGSSPAFDNGPISQTLSGLTVGKPVVVSFDYAGAQQFGFSGPSEEGWAVSLGSETQDTALVSISSHGFSGWKTASFIFTPTSSSEVLNFMAIGSTRDDQPFALLSGVSVDPIPEPSTWAMMLLGFAGLAFVGYRQTRRARPQAA